MANELEKTVEAETVEKTETKDSEKEQTAKDLEKRIKELEAENGKLRQANTNASADASKWKRQYQEKLSEEDRKREEQEETTANLQKELESLRAERNVANYKAQLVTIGFDDTLAQEVGQHLNDGNIAEIFDGLRKFIAAHDKALRESAFRNNPVLQGGGATKAISKAEFDKMGYTERLKVYQEHPELYQEFTK